MQLIGPIPLERNMIGVNGLTWSADMFDPSTPPVLGSICGLCQWFYQGAPFDWRYGLYAGSNVSWTQWQGPQTTHSGTPVTMDTINWLMNTSGIEGMVIGPYGANLSLNNLTQLSDYEILVQSLQAADNSFTSIVIGAEEYGNWAWNLANLIQDPTTAPSLGATSGNLPSGTYRVAYTYQNNNINQNTGRLGETMCSPTGTITLTSTGAITVQSLLPLPSGNYTPSYGATSVNYYLSQTNQDTLYLMTNGSGDVITLDLLPTGSEALPPTFNSCITPDHRAETYAQIAVPILQYLRSVVPNMKLGIVFDFTDSQAKTTLAWDKIVFQACAPYIDFISTHAYPINAIEQLPTNSFLKYTRTIKGTIQNQLRPLLNEWSPTYGPGVAIWITEFNPYSNNTMGQTGGSTYALAFIEYVLTYLTYGVGKVIWWSYDGGVLPAGTALQLAYTGSVSSATVVIEFDQTHMLATRFTTYVNGVVDIDVALSAFYPGAQANVGNGILYTINDLKSYISAHSSNYTFGETQGGIALSHLRGVSSADILQSNLWAATGGWYNLRCFTQGDGLQTFSLAGDSGTNYGVGENILLPSGLAAAQLMSAIGSGAELYLYEDYLEVNNIFIAQINSSTQDIWFVANNNASPRRVGQLLISGTQMYMLQGSPWDNSSTTLNVWG